MPPELRELLQRSVQHPPPEAHAVESVVRRAEASRRRRRGLTVGGGALATLALVAGGALLAPHLRSDAPPPADDRVVGPVVHPEDAGTAREGVDYDLRSTFVDQDLDRRNGRLHPQVDAAGEVLVQQPVWRDPGDALTEYDRYGVQDPRSGKVSWLPAPPGATYATDHSPSGPRVVDLTATQVLWLDEQTPKGATFHVYDRASGAWTEGRLPAAGRRLDGGYFYVRLAAGRVWASGSVAGERTTLWSVPADGSATPRREGMVGDWDVDDEKLVWTRWHNRPNDLMTVRDLRTGREHSFDPQSGDHCNQLSLALTGDRIASGQYCGERRKVRDDRVQVVSTSGEQVVTAQGDGVELGGLADSFLLVSKYDSGAGSYVYDFTDRRLLRLSHSFGKFGDAIGAGGSTLTWNTPVNHDHGIKLWTATWR